MTMPNDSDEVADDRLRNAFRAAGDPASPDLAPRVRRLIRRKRTVKRLGAGAAAAVVVATSFFVWQNWPRAPDRSVAGGGEPTPPPRIEPDPPLPPGLFTGPPVDLLGTVTRQQDAYVVALQGLAED
jgi:hypothetical protein